LTKIWIIGSAIIRKDHFDKIADSTTIFSPQPIERIHQLRLILTVQVCSLNWSITAHLIAACSMNCFGLITTQAIYRHNVSKVNSKNYYKLF